MEVCYVRENNGITSTWEMYAPQRHGNTPLTGEKWKERETLRTPTSTSIKQTQRTSERQCPNAKSLCQLWDLTAAAFTLSSKRTDTREQLHTRVSKFMLAVFPSTVTLRLEPSFTLTQSSPNMSLKMNKDTASVENAFMWSRVLYTWGKIILKTGLSFHVEYFYRYVCLLEMCLPSDILLIS